MLVKTPMFLIFLKSYIWTSSDKYCAGPAALRNINLQIKKWRGEAGKKAD